MAFKGNIFHDEKQQPHEKPDEAPVKWRLSSYAAIFNAKSEVLLVQPTAYPDLWDLPGGGIEVDESIVEATEREVMEEAKYRIKASEIPLYIGEDNFFYNGDYFHAVIIIIKGKLLSEKRNESFVNPEGDEIKDFKWIHPDEIDESTINPIYRTYIASLKTNE